MTLNFKKITIFILIVFGFSFFLLNAYELNSINKNVKIQKTTHLLQNASDINNKSEVNKDNLVNDLSKKFNELNKETIVIVEKGQTFSSILDKFSLVFFPNRIDEAFLTFFKSSSECTILVISSDINF